MLNTNEPKREVMQSHKGDKRCICTDGREGERDVCETCDSDIEDRTQRKE